MSFSLTTNSNTNVKDDFVWIISWRVTMLLCLSSLSKDASLMAVKGAPSSSCNLISFNATTCFVKLENEIEDFDVLPTVPKF